MLSTTFSTQSSGPPTRGTTASTMNNLTLPSTPFLHNTFRATSAWRLPSNHKMDEYIPQDCFNRPHRLPFHTIHITPLDVELDTSGPAFSADNLNQVIPSVFLPRPASAPPIHCHASLARALKHENQLEPPPHHTHRHHESSHSTGPHCHRHASAPSRTVRENPKQHAQHSDHHPPPTVGPTHPRLLHDADIR